MEEGNHRSRVANSVKSNAGFFMERQPDSASRKASEFPSSASTSIAPLSSIASSSLLDRFRVFLREREDEMGVSWKGHNQEEMVDLYREALAELTFNSKPIITDLTIIAGEHVDFGKGITAVICSRIVQISAEQKLPTFYLLDSIVKNIGGDYVRYFAAQLPEVFCKTYRQVDSSLRPAMRHLFRTWSGVFPSNTLCAIESELQFSPTRNQSGFPPSRPVETNSSMPSHGIHVNPKYLEARKRMDHANMIHKGSPQNSFQSSSFEEENLELTTGSPNIMSGPLTKFHGKQLQVHVTSPVHTYSVIPHGRCGLYEIDQTEVSSPGIGTRKRDLANSLMPNLPPYALGSKKMFSPSRVGVSTSLSPTSSSLPWESGFPVNNSPRKTVPAESVSLLSSPFGEFKTGSDPRDLQDMHWSFDGNRGITSAVPTHQKKNGYNQPHRPLQSIETDSYGKHLSSGALDRNMSKSEQHVATRSNSGSTTRSWQNSEEEEYVWEDMSPTLSDRNKKNSLAPSECSFGSLGASMKLQKRNPHMLKNSYAGQDLQSFSNHPHSFGDENFIPRPVSTYRESLHSRDNWNNTAPHIRASEAVEERKTAMPSQRSQKHLEHSSLISTTSKFSSPSGGFPRLSGQLIPSTSGHVLHNGISTRYSSSSVKSGTLQPEYYGFDNLLASKLPEKYAPRISDMPSIARRPHSHKGPALHGGQISRLSQQDSNIEFKTSEVNRRQDVLMDPFSLVDDIKHPADPNRLMELPYQNPLLTHSNKADQDQGIAVFPQQEKPMGSGGSLISGHVFPYPMHEGVVQASHSIGGIAPMNPSRLAPLFLPGNVPLHLLGRPPLPLDPPPASIQVRPALQNSGTIVPHPLSGSSLGAAQQGSALTGLISSLMAQGLLKPPPSLQDPIGLEFDEQILKVRHDPIINALYADLPRQCTTCGMRFKSQEAHSNHMDWHVTRNRSSKNRKQKQSRRWFISAKEWLSSGAECMGVEVPAFLPTETISEKTEEEMAVPADENQNVCALCGEPFENFYSDELEEWMYRDAVYTNAPNGFTEEMERSQLGPIVHSKCRSESTSVPAAADHNTVEMFPGQ